MDNTKGRIHNIIRKNHGSKTGNEGKVSFEDRGEGIQLYRLLDDQIRKFQGQSDCVTIVTVPKDQPNLYVSFQVMCSERTFFFFLLDKQKFAYWELEFLPICLHRSKPVFLPFLRVKQFDASYCCILCTILILPFQTYHMYFASSN